MMLFSLQIESPLILLLLPLAFLPWAARNNEKVIAWDAFIPIDPVSRYIDIAIKTLSSLVIAGLIIALTNPYLPEYSKEHIGKGAEFVILLDRSRSMDDPFAVTDTAQRVNHDLSKSKRHVATHYLEEFVASRPDDRFGFILFSTHVMPLLPLTDNKSALLATIHASGLGKGLSETNVGQALIQAAKLYHEQPYSGSRVILLISDGGEELSESEKETISQLYRKNNLTLYWIYLRSIHGMTLDEEAGETLLWKDAPERKLHTFFKQTHLPYRVFEADTNSDFFAAVSEINLAQFQPLLVKELVPKRSLARFFLSIVFVVLSVLVVIRFYSFWGMNQPE